MSETTGRKSITRLEGKVAGVLSERELTINIGSNEGVQIGMKFKVLSAEPIDVRDPETDDLLGIVDREKVRVRVIEVEEKFAICKTYRKWTTSGGPLYGLGVVSRAWVEEPKTVHETLKAEDSTLPLPLSEDESYVKKGDRVILVTEEEDD
jgi:hypothetical protein